MKLFKSASFTETLLHAVWQSEKEVYNPVPSAGSIQASVASQFQLTGVTHDVWQAVREV